MTTLFLSADRNLDDWIAAWRETAPDRPILVHGQDDYDPARIDYALTWRPPSGVMQTLPNLKAIFNMGAGVDAVVADPDRPPVPIVRLVDNDLAVRMSEYVVLQVLSHFRQAPAYAAQQARREWTPHDQPSAPSARVGLMGYGVLAQHCAPILLALGFNVIGWSRSKKPSDITLYHGRDGLPEFLARTDILVCLLPMTEDTRGILNADLIAQLSTASPVGPVLINAGRGGLQKSDEILAALQSGALKGASLDVFETEPLPADSPLWDAPNLIITPHVAAVPDPAATVTSITSRMTAFERGDPVAGLVDPVRGY
ncbi:2-hydroxyacid dehydrogenase [Acuticoccus yangtzensis]|uniref:2-hydroxyacid dehydrogenase n=1 Tax=Acuticoccus yangtzensis TaxID=1443441 RepID=UPI000949B13B|nr:glyoxylate/hydroxypyruvate reductase A [Acuticoccus yangtzensis]